MRTEICSPSLPLAVGAELVVRANPLCGRATSLGCLPLPWNPPESIVPTEADLYQEGFRQRKGKFLHMDGIGGGSDEIAKHTKPGLGAGPAGGRGGPGHLVLAAADGAG
ncbi:hypothetical protein D3C80_1688110 [compost metagenome]